MRLIRNVVKYFASLVLVLAAFALTMAFPKDAPVVSAFGIAILVSSYWCGLGPGVFTAVVSILINSWYMEPGGSFRVSGGGDVVRLAFLAILVFVYRARKHKDETRNLLTARTHELENVLALIRPRLPICY